MKIELSNYSKVIKRRTVLDHVNCIFYSGNIYGLYGRNGSGKTMLLRAISGLIYGTHGKVVIDGKVLHKDISFPKSMGVIIENTNLLPNYDAYTNLKILSNIKKIASDNDINDALSSVGLDPSNKKKVRTYSLGMRQRLSIAQALFEDPNLLLLDEPTNALDESSVEIVRNLLLKKKEQGTLIIIASHNKEDLNILADQIIKVVDGKVILS
ncbi:ATP-binding cassette domain-containing protein [Sporolactobacillus shoreicorticis]|uniref:ATP-binding cassette domain-containing protein n=1 Tax=Sporolactobacillus shoreicorticis TaxID=1923877 RepID=A0ABW5S0Z6_9BACL|nr:ATP-binding cassette domain-containing protein [Sporolactobacillus shoreicorticis]MCO7128259.1 ATP-binding cassette domain-containing protein [Sporolactobacillus shoreicorticis]